MTHNAQPRSADEIIADAAKIKDFPEIERFRRVNLLIKESRATGATIQEQIITAANYDDVNKYWEVALAEPISVTYFGFLLKINQSGGHKFAGKAERSLSYRMSRLVDDALEYACKRKQISFLGVHPRDTDDAEEDWCRGLMLYPRRATQWLLNNPKRRDLVPASLRQYMRQIEDGLTETPPLPTPAHTQRTKTPSQEQVDQIKSLFKGYIADMKRDDAIQKITEELNISREAVRAQQVKSTRGRGVKIVRDKLNS